MLEVVTVKGNENKELRKDIVCFRVISFRKAEKIKSVRHVIFYCLRTWLSRKYQ